ncbi:gonadotropin-releasing hormone receptor [Anastrepha obliqua]|uniref:gonadotropin-releasing hormone receptor n=1 Tax=Anastrepha obliqua TaxID=95512 RepID=UPI002408FEE6|nr:gonadotropin-releasing hormone receptor [Anastrepha obliqua]XP_054736094.1 gonadotropin-releasing hormone receptor [Anastrepha obliqua]XP_054736095.1 gonadotropin-releasing hormone receptor [Anastrepha obliqua]XP_054736096.1 gonadotropin-releasing hormone receptor [Anastrepha obliqua]
MDSESVVESSISHPLTEVFRRNFLQNLTNARENFAKHASNSTLPAAMDTVATSPHLGEVFFTISTNSSDNVTLFPLLVDTHKVFAENDSIQLDHAPQLSQSTMIKVYVLTVMAVLSLFGNVLTMWNIYKTRIQRRSSRHSWSAIYSLIFHLSIADLLVTCFCIIGEAAWFYTVQWLADEITCKLVKLFQMFSLYLSTYVLVLIGVDRWIAVKYPMKSLNMAKRCYRLLAGTYVLSFLLSLPQFFIFHLARGPFVEEFHQCVTHGFYTAHWQEQLYTTFTLIFTFLLPLCILFVTYASTFRTISSSEKMFLGPKLVANSTINSMQTNRQRIIHKAKMKSLRISFVIIIAFLICWTPYYIVMVTLMFLNPDKKLSEGLVSAIFVFGMSNSLVNPLIYGAFHLHPMKRKASQKGGHTACSLNRADSQRTPSILTAVTQIDGSGRHTRVNRQPSYYRTHSNGSNSKEQVSLLQISSTAAIVHKLNSSSERSSLFSQQTATTNLTRNDMDEIKDESEDTKRETDTHSTVIYCYKSLKPTNSLAKSSETLAISPCNRLHSPQRTPVSENDFRRTVCVNSYKNKMGTDESVSSV